MKALFYILFSLLIVINAHANGHGNNETHPQQNQHHNQKTFLVKTTLTKEQVESLLKQHQEKNQLENPSQVEPIQLKKKGKSKKNHKKEPTPEQGVPEAEVNKTEVIEPSEPIDAEKISLGLFDFFFDDYDDNNDTEDLPEPDLEKPQNQTEISETTGTTENAETTQTTEKTETPETQEKGEIPESAETAAENTPNENENEKVTLKVKEDSIKTANTQSGMTISGFFSLILLTIAFGCFLVYATQPKKLNKNYSSFLNGIKIS